MSMLWPCSLQRQGCCLLKSELLQSYQSLFVIVMPELLKLTPDNALLTSLKLFAPPCVKKALTLGWPSTSFWGAHFTTLMLLLTGRLLLFSMTLSVSDSFQRALVGAIAASPCAMALSSATSACNTCPDGGLCLLSEQQICCIKEVQALH